LILVVTICHRTIRANRPAIWEAKESIALFHVFSQRTERRGKFRAKLQNSHLCGLPKSCGASAIASLLLCMIGIKAAWTAR
jgi:hypothetical protein